MRGLISKTLQCLSWVLHHTPVLNKLVLAKRSSWKASLAETGVGTLFSTLPIWFFPVVLSNMITGSPPTLELMYNSVSRGDFFLYSAALMGPLIYTIMRNYAQRVDDGSDASGVDQAASKMPFLKYTFEFPYGGFFVLAAIFVCMVAAVCYGLSNLSSVANSGFTVSESFSVQASIWVYIFSLVCLFAVSTFKEELSTLNRNLPQDERDFYEKWKAR